MAYRILTEREATNKISYTVGSNSTTKCCVRSVAISLYGPNGRPIGVQTLPYDADNMLIYDCWRINL